MINLQEMSVLIVDDMPSMTKYIHKMMRNIGYGKDFFFAHSGNEALSVMRKEHIDLVLMDYNMPEMTGGEALSQIREDRELRDTTVIMVTAEAYSDFVAEIGESEVDAYILKPLTISLMQEKIAAAVEKSNNPPPMIYHLKRARAFEEQGEVDLAIKEARLAMDANPNSTKPVREIGYYYYLKNDLDEAESWLKKAADKNKLDVFAFHYLGEIYLKRDNIEKASFYLEKAMDISPRHIDRGINFAKTLVGMGAAPKAIQVFDKILELSGNRLELREEIAEFCVEKNVNEYAVSLLESIVGEQPNRADVLFRMAQALEKEGDISRAVPHLVRAGEIDKENIDIKIHLARDYLTLKKPMLAEKPLRAIIDTNPDNELAKELLKQCV